MELLPRYPLIFNPKARSQRGRKALKFIVDNVERFALYATRTPTEAEELARTFAERGEEIVVAAGGDGTMNAIVRGLSNSQTALGMLPTGTMNVFARELGIPFDQLGKSLKVIDEGLIEEVDLFYANGHPFLQMAGVGFDAQVIQKTSWESKKTFGALSYLFSAVKVLGEKPPQMTVRTDDGREYEGVCVLVGNGALYGGQVRLFTKACNQDGHMDVLIYNESGYRIIIDSLKGVAMGDLDRYGKSVEYIQAREITVSCDRPVPVEVDGDFSEEAETVTFRPGSQKLRVLGTGGRAESDVSSMLRGLVGKG